MAEHGRPTASGEGKSWSHLAPPPPSSTAPPWADIMGESRGEGAPPSFVIKNTFIDEVKSPMAQRAMRRSKSESSISSASARDEAGQNQDEFNLWLPDFSSQSGRSGSAFSQGDDETSPRRTAPAPPPRWNLATARAVAEKGLFDEFSVDGETVSPTSFVSSQVNSRGMGYFQMPLGFDMAPAQAPMPGPASPRVKDAKVSKSRPQASPQVRNAVLPPSTSTDSYVQQVHEETQVPIADLLALEAQGLLRTIPRDEQGKLTSIGSVHHAEKECFPCLFWFNNNCAKNVRCSYCHFKHKGQKKKRIRPSKATRQRLRDSAEGDEGEDEEAADVDEAPLSSMRDQTQQDFEAFEQARADPGRSERAAQERAAFANMQPQPVPLTKIRLSL